MKGNKMKKIYLHIGPYKTGTSYLQLLWNNNAKSLEENGFIYPQITLENNAHHGLVSLFKKGNMESDSNETIKYLNELEEDIILSSENFSVLNKRSLLNIRKIFSNKKIIVIFYFRNPTQQLLSRWQEKIKYGNVQSFFEYTSYFVMHPFKTHDINYFPLFEIIIDVFGKDNLYLIDYDSAYKNQTMLAEFDKVLGKDNFIKETKETINKMTDLAEIEILRTLNYKASKDGRNIDYSVQNNFKDKLRNNLINIDSLVQKIHKYDQDILLGNTVADRAIYNKLKHNYEDCFVNNIAGPNEKKYQVIGNEWVLDKNLTAEVDTIYKVLFDDS